mgnify:FL=1|jgi:N-acetylneuraminate synthase|tara:strand:+ start:331 stop:501 length:171 start_codon:yes stop_codon:yes gene_type:complete
MYGSDQAASVGPAGLRMLVWAVHKIEKAMGNGGLVILGEIPMIKKLRSYISNWVSK